MCEVEGKTEVISTPATRVWIPDFLERWVPKHARRKGFISLKEAAAKDVRFEALIQEHNGRREGKRVCNAHGLMLREAKIWTSQLSRVMQRKTEIAQRRAAEAFSSVASILGPDKIVGIQTATKSRK